MKLYTEEHLKIFYHLGKIDGFIGREDDINELIKNYPPIELPSDEEIKEYVKSTGYYGHCTHEYHEGIEEDAKYVINKIQGGNK